MVGEGGMATVNLVHNAPEAGWAEGSRSHLVASSRAAVGVQRCGGEVEYRHLPDDAYACP